MPSLESRSGDPRDRHDTQTCEVTRSDPWFLVGGFDSHQDRDSKPPSHLANLI